MLARTYDVEADNDNDTHTYTHTYLYIKGVHRPPEQIKTKPPETEIEIGREKPKNRRFSCCKFDVILPIKAQLPSSTE